MAENLKKLLILSTSGGYEIPDVKITDERAVGGERIAIITLIDSTKDGDIGKIGGIFGSVQVFHEEKLYDFDSVSVVVEDIYKNTRAVIACNMKDIQDFASKKITSGEFMKKWMVTMRASGYEDEAAKEYGWE